MDRALQRGGEIDQGSIPTDSGQTSPASSGP